MDIYIPIFLSLFAPIAAELSSYFLKFTDKPNSALKTHKREVPYVGGLTFIFVALISLVFLDYKIVSISLLLIALLGILDDFVSINYKIRLGIETFIGTILTINLLPDSNIIVTILGLFLCLTLINGLNFIDIKDGLATFYSSLVFIYLVSIIPPGSTFYMFMIFVILSQLVFYYFNSEPAKYYQGDGGSYSLGMIMYIGLINTYNSISDIVDFSSISFDSDSLLKYNISLDSTNLGFILYIICLLPIFLELILVIIFRFQKGLNPFLGSPDHIAIRLTKRGYSTYKVSFIFALLPVISTLIFLLIKAEISFISVLMTFILAGIFIYKYLKNCI